MTSGETPEIYPQYCSELSQTINRWCHLRVADVVALTTYPDFQGQDLYFHINHPIRWVYVAGVIVAIDEVYSRRIYTVDDGSGVNIECVTTIAVAGQLAASASASAAALQQRRHTNPKIPDNIDVGLVVKVRGGLGTFRDAIQIKIDSLDVLRSTRQEVEFWRKVTDLRETVLGQPWSLSRREVRRCRRKAEGEDEKKGSRKGSRAEARVHGEEIGSRRAITGLEPTSRSAAGGTGDNPSAPRGITVSNTTGLEPVSRANTDGSASTSTSRRITGLEPAPSRTSAVAIAAAVGDGASTSTSRRSTRVEPATSMTSAIAAAVDGSAFASRRNTTGFEPLPKVATGGTLRKPTGLEPASRMPTAAAAARDGASPLCRMTGLEPASSMSGAASGAGSGASTFRRITGLEPLSRRAAATVTQAPKPKRNTGLEPVVQGSAPGHVMPRPTRITGLERRVRHG